MRERNGRKGLSSGKPKLGQHFLASSRILERIADAACAPGTDRGAIEQIIEIGPGRGALTEQLLARAQRVIAIEMDRELAAELHDRWPDLQLVEGDALGVDWNQWGPGVLAGNLPYYVATAIISKYLNHAGPLRQAVFLIQKEVAERITAKPGTRDFGYLSVECQYLAKAEYLFSVPPGAFRPPPKVDSAVIRLTPRVAVASAEDKAFLGFASVCFRQKRKTLRNNLTAVYPKEKLEGLSQRAEQLSVAELVELFHSLRGAPPGTPIC
jgi:16S rRNA (adenine1518-N6/adenine1519-N6)-dimethyltransferase